MILSRNTLLKMALGLVTAFVAAFAAAVAASGCATSGSGRDVVVRWAGHAASVTVAGSRIFGPDTSVVIKDHQISGTLRDRPAMLDIQRGQVSGLLGGQAVLLSTRRTPARPREVTAARPAPGPTASSKAAGPSACPAAGAPDGHAIGGAAGSVAAGCRLEAHGFIAGQRAELELSDDKLVARAAGCSYQLRRTEPGGGDQVATVVYQGWSLCGSLSSTTARVSGLDVLRALGDEAASLLILSLLSGC
jgi:hypothetical protein